VASSRHAAAWIRQEGAGHATVDVFRRALSDELVLMYMGFADASGMTELEKSLEELKARRRTLSDELDALAQRRDQISGATQAVPASPDPSGEPQRRVSVGSADSQRIARRLEDGGRQLAKLDQQIAARARALPLYRSVIESEALAPALRSQRRHPVHTLLRRIYHER